MKITNAGRRANGTSLELDLNYTPVKLFIKFGIVKVAKSSVKPVPVQTCHTVKTLGNKCR